MTGCCPAPATARLSLFSLVVSAGAETPVHDHLAWGLVGPIAVHDLRRDLRLDPIC